MAETLTSYYAVGQQLEGASEMPLEQLRDIATQLEDARASGELNPRQYKEVMIYLGRIAFEVSFRNELTPAQMKEAIVGGDLDSEFESEPELVAA